MPRVLIAEDDLQIADMMQDFLVGAGYEVCGIARTVAEGVALGERHRPDLAVLDVRLADGGLGTEIAARLGRQGSLGILYATANTSGIVLATSDGEACITKPYGADNLVRALRIVERIVGGGTPSPPFPRGFRLLGSNAVGCPSEASTHG
jgi:DNA-binding response OmpR family regulator